MKIAPAAMKALLNYHWPGNVRELENIIERALVIGRGKAITPGELPFRQKTAVSENLPKSLKKMEEEHIRRILDDAGWNISKAARELDIDRQTLYNKIRKYGLESGEK
jgi:transcriptional regulator of acetoin/glycerol metabolism